MLKITSTGGRLFYLDKTGKRYPSGAGWRVIDEDGDEAFHLREEHAPKGMHELKGLVLFILWQKEEAYKKGKNAGTAELQNSLCNLIGARFVDTMALEG